MSLDQILQEANLAADELEAQVADAKKELENRQRALVRLKERLALLRGASVHFNNQSKKEPALESV